LPGSSRQSRSSGHGIANPNEITGTDPRIKSGDGDDSESAISREFAMGQLHSLGTRRSLTQAAVGVGLKPEHADDIFALPHAVQFFEIHAENYMGAGGPPHHLLRRVRSRFPLSLHGVGLSIGAPQPLDRDHLAGLKSLVKRYEPQLFSEHLAWSTHDGVFLNDLLPLPYNRETLAHVCDHIDEVQDALGMRMLLENPSTYVAFETSTMREVDFLRQVVSQTGCGLLLDVSNVYVSAVNHGFEPMVYIDAFPVEHVGEIHLAGFAPDRDDDGSRLLIDSHANPVAEVVWALFRRTLTRTGPVPTLIEWDNDVPAFPVLSAEAERAKAIVAAEAQRQCRRAAA
jgi:uncharacterized protein